MKAETIADDVIGDLTDGKTVTLSREGEFARELIEHTGQSVFLTGKAGTGKTTFLRRLKERSVKRLVVLAPTGIAAINAGGVTIHSFFQLPFHPFAGTVERDSFKKMSSDKVRLIRSLDLIVIDEISMVRADLLDAVDYELRRIRRNQNPFGGVQLLMIGDLQQLPPVVTEADRQILDGRYSTFYFFGSRALADLDYLMIELKEVYRQTDPQFIALLNKIRNNAAGASDLALLNSRYIPGFRSGEDEYIRLMTHNEQARRINLQELEALPADVSRYKAIVKEDFPEQMYPADSLLTLKVGAQVMFVKNDSSPQKSYYNGLIGRVESLENDAVFVRVKGKDEPVRVTRESWQNTTFKVNDESGAVEEKVIGTFSQFPLRTAWAVTIHKSQGLTFDHAVIDASRSFAHGQCYVALSRCRTLEGIVLDAPLTPSAIISDGVVSSYIASRRNDLQNASVAQFRLRYRSMLLDEVFSPSTLRLEMSAGLRTVSEAFGRVHPQLVVDWDTMCGKTLPELERVSASFSSQIISLLNTGDNEGLVKRLEAANDYYSDIYRKIHHLLVSTPETTDNARMSKRLKSELAALIPLAEEKIILLGELKLSGYSVEECLAARAAARLDAEAEPGKGGKKRRSAPLPQDIVNPELFTALVEWRIAKSRERASTPARVLSYKALLGIASESPENLAALRRIEGVSRARAKEYGGELLEIVRRHSDRSEDEATLWSADTSDSATNDLVEKLKEWRARKMKELGIPAYMILYNRTIEELAEAKPCCRSELLEVKGIGEKNASRFGEEILAVINGSDIK